MELNCPVSIGEVLDKISVLRIKLARIKDESKLLHVRTELEKLIGLFPDMGPYEPYLQRLMEHNTVIWDVEDALRLKEKRKEYDAQFIQLARQAFTTNDRRFAVKNEVNERFGSLIREQKSYG
jgi:hypothetical protein